MKNRFYLLMIFLFLILGCKFEGKGKHGGCVYRVIDDNSVCFSGWTEEAIKKSKGNMHIPEKIYYFDVVAVENDGPYSDTAIKSIVIPPTVKTIYGLPNKSDKTLEKIELSKGLIAIGEGAFCGYKRLKNIDLPEGLTSMGKAAFKECESLREITLPDSLKEIPVDAFFKCSSLWDVSLPKKLKLIYGGAFQECKSLTNISFPNTLEEIYPYAFSASSLNTVTFLSLIHI